MGKEGGYCGSRDSILGGGDEKKKKKGNEEKKSGIKNKKDICLSCIT